MAFNSLGVVAEHRGDLATSQELHSQALALREGLAPESLAVATSLNNLGLVAWRRRDLDRAETLFRRALIIRERLAPDSMELSAVVNNLGNLAWHRGDLDAAERAYRRALDIRERRAPEGLAVATSLNNLGLVADSRGDLSAAEDFHRRSLEIKRRLAPGGLDVAMSLGNLAAVAWLRGDIARAEFSFREALAIFERLAPGGLEVASSLDNLGVMAQERGDLAEATHLTRMALTIRERLAPDSLHVAMALNNLGNIAWDGRDLAEAEAYYRRALEIRRRAAPEGLDTARSLSNLGVVLLERGDPTAAEEQLQSALALRENVAPQGLEVAESFHELGNAARRRGALPESEALYRRALSLRERLAPGTTAAAESLHGLGALFAGSERIQEAAEMLCRAVDSFESQKARLGGTEETRTAFGAKYADYYRECAEALERLDRKDEAFQLVERFRARSLLTMLAERDLTLGDDLPSGIAEEKRRADREYEGVQEALAKLQAARDAEQVDHLLARLRELGAQRESIVSRIRETAPGVATLQYPLPASLAAARTALDPGTVLLSYLVGAERTLLFVVGAASRDDRGTFEVLPLPIGRSRLFERVEGLRRQIGRHDPRQRAAIGAQAAEIYDLLVRPAEAFMGSANRILISPDGPLHTLPFAALVRTQATSGAPGLRPGKGRPKSQKPADQYFVEWKPIHTVVSATVYAELKKTRRERSAAEVAVAAFGDPRYPFVSQERADSIASAEVRSAVTRGFAFDPLPASRDEVKAIAGLYGPSVREYLGPEATEERAKALGKDVRYIHFAAHGLVDERFPLSSALALTIPEKPAEGQDNGLLQAWEVFEKVRIDADLVTLSACETALGKEMGGEGLVGLTRAFQYAGARSILASLWSVGDASTADLMKRFYGYLKAGKTKDEALRAAQVDLIHSDRFAHPFHWAAFQLIGDWK